MSGALPAAAAFMPMAWNAAPPCRPRCARHDTRPCWCRRRWCVRGAVPPLSFFGEVGQVDAGLVENFLDGLDGEPVEDVLAVRDAVPLGAVALHDVALPGTVRGGHRPDNGARRGAGTASGGRGGRVRVG